MMLPRPIVGGLVSGPQYRVFFERWFDDLWASIPDSYLVYSRNGFTKSAISIASGRNSKPSSHRRVVRPLERSS